MGYEAKTRIEACILDSKYPDKFVEMAIKQFEEVYAKAKAWDNYLADVESSVREVTGNEDDVKWHVDYAINEYMEDK